jgi:hypothetical protein
MRIRFAVTIVGLGLLASTLPIPAHHSITAEYDLSKTITISGTVTKTEWMNPHARFFVDAEADAAVTHWEIEMGSPNGLMRLGWSRNTIQKGDQIRVEASPAKDGSKLGFARTLTWPDGRTMTVPADNWMMRTAAPLKR